MKKPTSRSYPVTVTSLALVRCAVCGRRLAVRKGSASQALTAHYAKVHAALLERDAGPE